MDHVRLPRDEMVTSYVARDGQVLSAASRAPTLAAGEVRVAVELTTLGSWTTFSGQGLEPLGDTFVGRILECGTEVDPSRLGSRVLGIVRSGAASSELVVPSFVTRPCDESYPAGVAAATATSGLVACLLVHAVDPAPGTVVAIRAGYGVSCMLAGMIRARGALPIALRDQVSEPSVLIEAGCIAVLGADSRPFDESIRVVTGGRLADVVIDTGHVPAPWAEVEPLLEPAGRAVTLAATDRIDWDLARSTSVGVIALAMRFFTADGDVIGRLADHISHLVADVVAGRLSLPVEEFPAHQAQAAYDRMLDRGRVGRIAIRFTPGP